MKMQNIVLDHLAAPKKNSAVSFSSEEFSNAFQAAYKKEVSTTNQSDGKSTEDVTKDKVVEGSDEEEILDLEATILPLFGWVEPINEVIVEDISLESAHDLVELQIESTTTPLQMNHSVEDRYPNEIVANGLLEQVDKVSDRHFPEMTEVEVPEVSINERLDQVSKQVPTIFEQADPFEMKNSNSLAEENANTEAVHEKTGKAIPSDEYSLDLMMESQQETIIHLKDGTEKQLANIESTTLDDQSSSALTEIASTQAPQVEENGTKVVSEQVDDVKETAKHENQSFTQILTDIQTPSTTVQVQASERIEVPETKWVTEIETLVLETVEMSEQVSTARIQLTPKNLGEMEIELMIKDNELTARFVVEQAETKEWLEQKVFELTSKLATQEIKVGEFEVFVSDQRESTLDSNLEENPFFKQQKETRKQNHSRRYAMNEEQQIETKQSRNETNTGRLSIWV